MSFPLAVAAFIRGWGGGGPAEELTTVQRCSSSRPPAFRSKFLPQRCLAYLPTDLPASFFVQFCWIRPSGRCSWQHWHDSYKIDIISSPKIDPSSSAGAVQSLPVIFRLQPQLYESFMHFIWNGTHVIFVVQSKNILKVICISDGIPIWAKVPFATVRCQQATWPGPQVMQLDVPYVSHIIMDSVPFGGGGPCLCHLNGICMGDRN